MTEDQIEWNVERQVDHLDAQFMSGKLTQDEYDACMKEVEAWADAEYRRIHCADANWFDPDRERFCAD